MRTFHQAILGPVTAKNHLCQTLCILVALVGVLIVSPATADITVGSLTVNGPGTLTDNTTVTGITAIGDTSFGTLTLPPYNLTTLELMVGDSHSVSGTLDQSAGTVRITGNTGATRGARLGHWPNETGTYTLSGTGNLITDGANDIFNVGWDGNGIFNHDGGTSTFGGDLRVNRRGTVNMNDGVMTTNAGLRIGYRSGTNDATFNMNGGTVNANTLGIGEQNGNGGTLTQNGGDINVSNWMRVGHWPNNSSSYTINDGTLSVVGRLSVGWDSSGTMTINGGSITAGSFNLGDHPNQSGTVTQNGGTVTVTGGSGENAAMRVGHWPGATSTYNLVGGVFNLTNPTHDLALGTDGTGIFHQTGGQANVFGVQVNHRNAGGGGTLIVEGTGVMNIGGRGLKVAAGTATLGGNSVTTVAGNVSVGDWNFADGPSKLTIEGNATLTANGNEFMLGDSNGVQGDLSQTGGTVNISGRTRIGHWPNNTSTYALVDGALNSSGEFNVGWDGTGIFTQTGGTSTFTGQLRVNRRGTVNMEGGVMNANGPLRIAVRSGSDTARFNLKDGTVNATSVGVGEAGGNAGQIVQTGGVMNASGLVRVGHWGNETSGYVLEDGTLNLTGAGADPNAFGERKGVLYLGIDGTGLFTQTGGLASAHGIHLDHRGNTGGIDTFTIEGGRFTVDAYGIQSSHSSILINLGGGTMAASADWSSPLPMALTGTGGNVTFDTAGHTITLSGALTGGGGLVKVGDGTLEMTATNNSFTGPTTVSGGVLKVTSAMIYPGPPNWQNRQITVNNGGVIEVGGWGDGATAGIGRVAFAREENILLDGGTIRYVGGQEGGRRDRSFAIGAGGATLEAEAAGVWYIENHATRPGAFPIVSNAGGTLTLSGSKDGELQKIIPGTGDVVKNGTGTWRLTGQNTYAGGTTVNQGVLELQGANNGNSSVGTGTLTINADGTVFALSHNVLGHSADANIPHVVINGGTLDLLEYMHIKSIEMTGGEVAQHGHFNGTGLDWGHAPRELTSHANATSATISAKMRLSGVLTIDVEDGAAADDLLISGPVDGGGGILKTGDGTLTMTGTNKNFTGPTTVDAGVLSVSEGMLYNIGWGNALTTVNDGGTLEVGGWADGDTAGIGRVSFNPANVVVDGGTIRYTGNTTTNRSDRAFTIGAGGATLEAAGGNDFSILDLGRPFPLASNAGGTLTLTGAADGVISKAIPGTGDLVKNGTGTWTLGGNNTYTGDTLINEGTLAMGASGSIGTTPRIVLADGATFDVSAVSAGFQVGAAQTLTGDGTVAGPMTVAGTVAPGLDVGILNTGDVTFQVDSFFDVFFEGTDVGTEYDQLAVAGIVQLGGANLDLGLGFVPTLGDQFIVIDNDENDPVSGIFAGLPDRSWLTADFGGRTYQFEINYAGGTGNDVVLTAVPEPATMILAALGALALALVRYRRRK